MMNLVATETADGEGSLTEAAAGSACAAGLGGKLASCSTGTSRLCYVAADLNR